MSMSAKVDFNPPSGGDPTLKPSLGGVCADVRSNTGSVTYNGGTSSSWTIGFTPPDSSASTGRNPIVLTAVRYGTNGGGNCNNTVVFSKSLGTAGARYRRRHGWQFRPGPVLDRQLSRRAGKLSQPADWEPRCHRRFHSSDR